MKAMVWFSILLIAVSGHAGIEGKVWSVTGGPGVPGDPTPTETTYSFRLTLVSGSLEPSASFSQHFTVYDVAGLNPKSVHQPAGWVSSVQNTGIDAADVRPGGRDNASIPNVTWRYTGTTRIVAPAPLGSFSFNLPSGTTLSPRLVVGQSSPGPTVLVRRTTP